MRKDEYALTKELRRLSKYGLLLQAKRVSYDEKEGYKYDILFTEDKRILEPGCSVSEVMGIINSLDTCLELQKTNSDEISSGELDEVEEELVQFGEDLFDILRMLRLDYSHKDKVPPYCVFGDKTLREMCIKLPTNKKEMMEIYGMGESKYEKYGDTFLRKIAEFVRDNTGG